MDDEEKKPDINNNDFLLYCTKYRPYDTINNINNNENGNESIELNEDENDNNNIINGRWSQKEHLLFIKGCLLYGNYWKKVKKYIQTRSCSQIRSHAQKYLNKLNKKYYGNKNNMNNFDINLKLNENDIKRLVNKNKFSEKDMDDAELYILSIFKGNKEKEKGLIDENEEKEIDQSNSNKKNYNEIDKIFNIIKVSREEKEKEREKEKKKLIEDNNKENNDNYENEKNNEINDLDNMDIDNNNNRNYLNENNSEENNKSSRNNKNKHKKILKDNIMAEKVDINSLTENEIFINQCLDSKDPKDLVKLLTHFGNDINFKVNDIKILKKYQDYLGLEIDNSEDNNNYNNYNNSNNKELNENYPIIDESINNQNQNNIYSYMFNPSNNSYQFNPLCNPKLLINPAFMNQY